MIKKTLFLTGLVCIAFFVFSQDKPTRDNRSKKIVDYSGNEFTFAIMADPQVSGKAHKGEVAVKAARTLEQACDEINGMDEMPLFTVFLGDLVNTFNKPSVDHFKYRIRNLQSTPLITHGNHDTPPPYTGFRELSREINGFDEVYYSFDVGDWHFVALPCRFFSNSALTEDMLSWLKKDLQNNAQKPTIVFEHFHLVPLGLSQLEWYTFDLKLRKRLLNLLGDHGNVKYYFNGHVHNGIKASVKMRWEYKGVKYITVPTIIQGRPFAEEYPGFEQGLEQGGYYLLVHVDGRDVKLEGRLANHDQGYTYPSDYPTLTKSVEPRWFQTIPEFPATRLENGDFSDNLDGWYKNYRYQADKDPAFIYSQRKFKGKDAAYLYTQAKPPLAWPHDERTEMYQVLTVEDIDNPYLELGYALEKKPVDGGGFLRLTAISEQGHEFLMFFRWGEENEYDADFIPRSLGYELTGERSTWRFLSDLAGRKKALFFDLKDSPGSWHQLKINIKDLYNQALGKYRVFSDGIRHEQVDIGELYDRALKKPNAYGQLDITKLYVGLATWCNKPLDAESGAYFSNVSLSDQANGPSSCDGEPFEINEKIYTTGFGQGLSDRIERRKERNKQQAFWDSLPDMHKVTVVDISELSEPERVMAASLQGHLVKHGSYLYLMREKDRIWIPELEKTGVELVYETDMNTLLDRYAEEFAGYVRCSLHNVRVGATIAGPKNALVVTPDAEPAAKSAGLSMLMDVSDRGEKWLYEYVLQNKDQYNLKAITQHNVNRPSSLIDFAMANNYICMKGRGKPSLVRKFYQLVETGSPRFGWATPYKKESKDVGLAARQGLYTLPSANTYNLSFYKATRKIFPRVNRKKNLPTLTEEKDEKVHYVMIMMSDGDNLNWHTSGLASKKYMKNPHCEDIPVSWMYPPQIVDEAPLLHNYYVNNYPSRNHLLGGVSGIGYTYPSMHRELEKYSIKTNEYLRKAGLDYTVIMDFEDFRTEQRKILSHMMEYMPHAKGLFYMDYSNYARWKGDAYFIDGKPVVSFKYRLWLPMDPMDKIAEKINEAPRNPGSIEGYSAVVVHAWSYDMDDVARFTKMLDKDVKIVGAHDFMRLIRKNLKD